MQVRRRNRRNIKHVSAHLTMRPSEPKSGAPARPISTKHPPPVEADLDWLRVMFNDDEAFLNIHPNRSIEVFEALIEKWNGILISDDYGVYQKWTAKRQTCLAHLIRRANGLRERKDPDIARFGIWCTSELQRLCNMAKKPPTQGEWNAFYARLCRLIGLYRDDKNDAGRMARRLDKEIESLFVFLDEEGVDPTNNHAERMLRYAVIWRKRSQGTESTKGQRWVERILTLRHTCKLRANFLEILFVTRNTPS